MEKKYRKNPQLELNVANWQTLEGTTTDKRIVSWSNTVPIAPSMDRLYQVILEGLHEKILFVKFEDLCLRPESEMIRIYQYLDIPHFAHDFDNIEQVTKEDDEVYGAFGDHIIRKQLKLPPSKAKQLLTPDVCNWVYTNYEWFYKYFRYSK
jgi:sulfotransferase